MTSPQKRVEHEVRRALKAQDKLELSTLRLLLNAINNERIRGGREVDESNFLTLVRKALKQRQDSIEQYRQGGREDLADREEQEAMILKRYLPPQVADDEIADAIHELVERESLSGPQAIGPIMKATLARFGDAADGATINRLAREILNEES